MLYTTILIKRRHNQHTGERDVTHATYRVTRERGKVITELRMEVAQA